MNVANFRRVTTLLPSISRLVCRGISAEQRLLYRKTPPFMNRYQALSLAHETKVKELSQKPPKPKTRKRRAISAAALYIQERDKLPQVVAIPLSETIDLKGILSSPHFLSFHNAAYVYEEFDDVLHLMKKDEYCVQKDDREGEVYIFEEGVVVFWKVDINERARLLRKLEEFMVNPYDSAISSQEQDTMPFALTSDPLSKIKYDCFLLSEGLHQKLEKSSDAILERFAFSHALAASVKVGVWEELLSSLSETQAHITKDLKKGIIRWGRKEALIRAGQFADLRNTVNTDCNLLNKDFYWERNDLQRYYKMAYGHLALERRIASLNRRLDYCEELVKVVDNVLANRMAARLEWMIIWLIVIEVIFDLHHYLDSSPKKVIVVCNPSETHE